MGSMVILDRHATEQKTIGKLPLRFRIRLSACPHCADGILTCDLMSGQGRDLGVETLASHPTPGNLSRML